MTGDHVTDEALHQDQLHQAERGESPSLNERLVVSPCDGKLWPAAVEYRTEGEYVLEGQVVASVLSSDQELRPICSPFAGWVMGYLVPDGSPVRASEPVLWLRKN